MRISLDPRELPDHWLNVVPYLTIDLPPLMSSSGYPLGPHDLRSLASTVMINQELERKEREVAVPRGVRDLYADWRPTPLYRAERFERSLGTPARIFYKYEGVSPSGSHEFNTAVPQAFYAAREGVKQVVTATATGEWGASLAIACNDFGLKCRVYMVRSSYDEKPHGGAMMEIRAALRELPGDFEAEAPDL